MPRTRLARTLAAVFALFAAVLVAGCVVSAASASTSTYHYDGVQHLSARAHASSAVTLPAGRTASGSGAATDDELTSGAATGAAAEGADEFVDLASSARRNHILAEDATGGGHLWPGLPGKTPFPRGWSADRVMHEVSEIATDPAAWRNVQYQGQRAVLNGARDGVDIKVVVSRQTGEIITGHPTNLPRNPW